MPESVVIARPPSPTSVSESKPIDGLCRGCLRALSQEDVYWIYAEALLFAYLQRNDERIRLRTRQMKGLLESFPHRRCPEHS